jgi:hypothetical protein
VAKVLPHSRHKRQAPSVLQVAQIDQTLPSLIAKPFWGNYSGLRALWGNNKKDPSRGYKNPVKIRVL